MHRSKAYASAEQKDSIVLPNGHFVPTPMVGDLHERSDPGRNLTGPFNVAAEPGTAVAEIVTEIARRYSHQAGYLVRKLKYLVAKHGDWAERPTLDQQLSVEKIRDLCGWKPRHMQFQDAVF